MELERVGIASDYGCSFFLLRGAMLGDLVLYNTASKSPAQARLVNSNKNNRL